MSTPPQEYLHALEHLLLQVRPLQVLSRKSSIRPVKLERLDRLPYPMDSLGRQWDHIRIRPHERVGRRIRDAVRVVESRLPRLSAMLTPNDAKERREQD